MNNTLKSAARVIRAVNHKLRTKMIDYIRTNTDITVTKLYVGLRLEQSVASQHLKILREAGVVTTRRDGKHIHYSVSEGRIKEINDICKELIS